MMELSETEVSLLRMSAGRMTPSEIAFALDISAEDVETKLEEIISKVDASSIESAIAAAADAGLLQIEI